MVHLVSTPCKKKNYFSNEHWRNHFVNTGWIWNRLFVNRYVHFYISDQCQTATTNEKSNSGFQWYRVHFPWSHKYLTQVNIFPTLLSLKMKFTPWAYFTGHRYMDFIYFKPQWLADSHNWQISKLKNTWNSFFRCLWNWPHLIKSTMYIAGIACSYLALPVRSSFIESVFSLCALPLLCGHNTGPATLEQNILTAINLNLSFI